MTSVHRDAGKKDRRKTGAAGADDTETGRAGGAEEGLDAGAPTGDGMGGEGLGGVDRAGSRPACRCGTRR